jgi:signal transduction histidine kinase
MNDGEPSCLRTAAEWLRFVSELTHELRAPLASFGMLADLLAESAGGRLNAQETRYCESLREVAQDLQALVGDAAELALLLGGRTAAAVQAAALEPLLDRVEDSVRPLAWERGIVLSRSLDPSPPPRWLRTDPERLRRLLMLLLETALGDARSEVLWRLEFERPGLRVEVSSDGAPFGEGAPAAMLQPFGDAAHALRRRGGRALGVPLAAELARLLGGSLLLANLGGRPTYEVSIPAVATTD